MTSLAIDPSSDSAERSVIPVRGHRFRDWIGRLGKRLSFEGLEDPPRTRHERADEGLSLEVVLPGFRARDVEVSCDTSTIAIAARRVSVDKREHTEVRAARIVLPLDDSLDPSTGSAEMRKGTLFVHLPVKDSAKVRNIPIRVQSH